VQCMTTEYMSEQLVQCMTTEYMSEGHSATDRR